MDTKVTPIKMYSTEWCGYCRRLKRQLESEGIAVEVIDADADAAASRMITDATGGFRIVPTLEIGPNLLVNPSINEVKAALKAS